MYEHDVCLTISNKFMFACLGARVKLLRQSNTDMG